MPHDSLNAQTVSVQCCTCVTEPIPIVGQSFSWRRRRQHAFHAIHPFVSSFQPDRPWNSVFAEASTNFEFWQRELTELALLQMRSFAAAAVGGQRLRADLAVGPPAKQRQLRGIMPPAPEGKGKGYVNNCP